MGYESKSKIITMITIRRYSHCDAEEAMEIWNSVVREGIAFPQVEELTENAADEFFSSQTYTGVAVDSQRMCWVST